MTTRPDFDPAAYETPELAELNRPLHALGWDMIEAEQLLTEMTRNRAPKAEWDAQFEVVTKARAAHSAALDALDVEVAAYCERAERAEAIAAASFNDEQIPLI
jgi:hypothetical protein